MSGIDHLLDTNIVIGLIKGSESERLKKRRSVQNCNHWLQKSVGPKTCSSWPVAGDEDE